MRWLLLLFCLLAAGCLGPGWPLQTPAEVLFHRGAEELAAGKEPQSLTTLIRRYPESPWTQRALSLSRLADEQKRLGDQLRSLEAEVSRSRREGKQKDEELARLRQDLERLKQLVIEMEKRAK